MTIVIDLILLLKTNFNTGRIAGQMPNQAAGLLLLASGFELEIKKYTFL